MRVTPGHRSMDLASAANCTLFFGVSYQRNSMFRHFSTPHPPLNECRESIPMCTIILN